MSSKSQWPNYHGLLLVNKPEGLTSHDLVAMIRRLAGQKRVGHIGTLDPLATGLMGILLGQATRLEPYLVKMGKLYTGSFRLGLSTDTNDITGNVLFQRAVELWPSAAEIKLKLEARLGETEQIPPAFSAIKVGGRRAYQAARAGEILELKARLVTAHRLELLACEPPEVKFLAEVSSGYYIRSLVRDLGDDLAVGATMTSLRRERVGSWSLAQAHSLAEIKNWGSAEWAAKVLPPADALPKWPEIFLKPLDEKAFQQGRQLVIENLTPGQYKVLSDQGHFIGLGGFSEESLPFTKTSLGGELPRGPFLRPLRVFNFGLRAEPPYDGKE